MKKIFKLLFIFTLLLSLLALVIGVLYISSFYAAESYSIVDALASFDMIGAFIYLPYFALIVFNIVVVIKNRKQDLEKNDYIALCIYYVMILVLVFGVVYVEKITLIRDIYYILPVVYYLGFFIVGDAIFRIYSILAFLKPKKIRKKVTVS